MIIKKKDNNSILATIIKIIKNIFELVNKFEKSISAFPYRSEFTVLVSVRIESVKDDLKSIVSKIKNPDNKNRLAKKHNKNKKSYSYIFVYNFLIRVK